MKKIILLLIVLIIGLLSVSLVSAGNCAGGTITTNSGYTIHTFTDNGTFDTTGCDVTEVEYLVVAGGGGGGAFAGGGAGGFRNGTLTVSSQSYTVTIGAGGEGGTSGNQGTNGKDSIFSTITSAGGGGGGAFSDANSDGLAGGSGGGSGVDSTSPYAPGTVGAGDTPDVTPNQGFDGGLGVATGGNAGGGGGGAGAVGVDATNNVGGTGGVGLAINFNGTSHFFAGGGGGGAGATIGVGGTGGGGSGGDGDNSPSATAGSPNTGGGGGGGYTFTGADGGSGIVMIKYKTVRTSGYDYTGANFDVSSFISSATWEKIDNTGVTVDSATLEDCGSGGCMSEAFDGGETSTNAFDSSWYYGVDTPNSDATLDLGASYCLGLIERVAPHDGGGTDYLRATRGFRIEYSDDEVTWNNFTGNTGTFTAPTGTNSRDNQTFTSIEARWVRFIHNNSDAGQMGNTEIIFYDDTSGVSCLSDTQAWQVNGTINVTGSDVNFTFNTNVNSYCAYYITDDQSEQYNYSQLMSLDTGYNITNTNQTFFTVNTTAVNGVNWVSLSCVEVTEEPVVKSVKIRNTIDTMMAGGSGTAPDSGGFSHYIGHDGNLKVNLIKFENITEYTDLVDRTVTSCKMELCVNFDYDTGVSQDFTLYNLTVNFTGTTTTYTESNIDAYWGNLTFSPNIADGLYNVTLNADYCTHLVSSNNPNKGFMARNLQGEARGGINNIYVTTGLNHGSTDCGTDKGYKLYMDYESADTVATLGAESLTNISTSGALKLNAEVNSAPTVVINSPPDNRIAPTQLTVNYTSTDGQSDNLDITLYVNDSTNQLQINQTVSSQAPGTYEITADGMFDGNYNYLIQACDPSALCTNTTARTYIVDTINPLFTWTYPAEDNTTVTGETSVTWDINCLNTNLDWVMFNVTNSTDNLASYHQTDLDTNTITIDNTTDISTWSDGTYDVTISCADTLTTLTQVKLFTVDNTVPTITNLRETPSDPAEWSSGATYLFNATVNDTRLDNVTIYFDGTNYSTSNVSDDFEYSIGSLAIGTYNYVWYAYDTVGNFVESSLQTYTVQDTQVPKVFGLIPTDGTDFSYSEEVDIYVNVTDNYQIDTISAIVQAPNSSNFTFTPANNTGNQYNFTFAQTGLAGVYTVYFTANDTSNNVNSTEFTQFTILAQGVADTTPSVASGIAGTGLLSCGIGEKLVNKTCVPILDTSILTGAVTGTVDGINSFGGKLKTLFQNMISFVAGDTTLAITEGDIETGVVQEVTTEELKENLRAIVGENLIAFFGAIGILLILLVLMHFGYLPYWAVLIVPFIYWALNKFI